MVEVFKTNVGQVAEAQVLLEKLGKSFPNYKINFDLEDCDKILLIEGKNINHQNVIVLVNKSNYQCEVLV